MSLDNIPLLHISFSNLLKDEYFILGDNRENSLDSRKFGPVKRDQILGKTHYVLFPFKRFGEVE